LEIKYVLGVQEIYLEVQGEAPAKDVKVEMKYMGWALRKYMGWAIGKDDAIPTNRVCNKSKRR